MPRVQTLKLTAALERAWDSRATRMIVLAVLLVGGFVSGVSYLGLGPLQVGTTAERLLVGERRRAYAVHLPAHHRGLAPLVVMFHGYGGSAAEIERVTGFSALADSVGFIVAYPEGERDRRMRRHWDAFSSRSIDVDFARILLDTLRRRYPVDSTGIYIVGFSQGAMMAYRVGAELADRVSAVGAASGTVGRRLEDGTVVHVPTPSQPVAVVMLHGTADGVVPYGTWSAPDEAMRVVSAAATAAFWGHANDCLAGPRTDTLAPNAVVRTAYGGCRDGADVVLYSLLGAGHVWITTSHPGGWPAATPLIWRFFVAHRRVRGR